MINIQSECKEKLRQAQIELMLEKDHVGQLEKLMNHNPDTGLLQRHILVRRMNNLISKKKSRFAFGILRLDKNYQRIRHTRDRMKVLLYVTSERLKPLVEEENLYQSDRSDEFLFIISDYESQEEVEKKIDDMIIRVSESHNPPASDVSFGCNVGVALYPDHANSLDELEQNAEIALGIYEEKSWNGFLYSPEIGRTYHENQSLEYILRMCILNNFEGFHIAYQPIVNKDKKLEACEALLRWDAPQRGSVSPVHFIPLAEESGLINYLGKWVLYNALKQVKVWREEMGQDIEMSVNVSSVQMEQADFVDTVETALRVLKIPGEALHLEITESVVMSNPEEIKIKLKALQDMGIEIMLDDFGTGYSSLSSLNQFPINTLKIAKEFVDNIPHDRHGVEMVRAILGIAETFGFRTLAEGIEQEDQFDCLIEEGCKYIQGYITSPPVAATEFEKLFFN
ncbi:MULTISPECIES: bifunctional diguanylate cyclase/phosphodiesterase [unclassified Oceanispirochaeta]|uniref:putative bifunctional diguanylate cyclase/phosphodiesterase n=1 Tax=unclassified Oceanispirochaeta TaxID=2635722 RepID=UPI000E08D32F|nr:MULTISPECIES: GGDEF domain-containing phosphodiesterase [unclassified Oceanispirochaeta]MBF9017368.1 EAL domain-containing protein [Oceanispirochaeta sp. M2]NPD73743.1 EAL domain-containing protein [Oceanispirochaeta sp. M1]RDG30495.1 GGDEF domain-containing protein [Oceanispirochaeta sp. M1]